MSECQEIVSFLKEHVVGRTLDTAELVYELGGGALEGVYSDRILFSNLCENQWGFDLDMFVISKERVYALDRQKRRAALNTDFSGVGVFRFELARRKSTGQITGIFRMVTASNKNQTAQAIACAIFDVKLEGGRLSWKEEQALYRDQPDGGGAFTPVAFCSDSSLSLENGLLVFDYRGTCLDVDPVTHSKAPSKSVYPSFVAREAGG